MRHFMLLLFSVSGGLTLSGLAANFYRLIARKPESPLEMGAYYGVMLLAGPSVLFENSTRSFRKKECSGFAYGFAVSLAAYWAFIIGLVVIDTTLMI